MAISDWPECERPREKLLRLGESSLTDAELLAIFLRTGVRGKSAIDLAREILNQFGSLGAVLDADQHQFCLVHGLGLAKYAQLQASIEISRRSLFHQCQQRDALTSPDSVRDYLSLKLRHLDHELFVCIFLDSQHRVIEYQEMFRGTLSCASVYPREVVKASLKVNAGAVIIAHNHPSGVAEPSQADIAMTQKLKDALALVDVKLLDHLVIGDELPISLAQRGLL